MRLIAGVCTHYVVYNISKKKNTVDKSKIKKTPPVARRLFLSGSSRLVVLGLHWREFHSCDMLMF